MEKESMTVWHKDTARLQPK